MATNTLGIYNPRFYANEALIHLRKALGMAGRVYMGYDEDRRSFNKGENIDIRRPTTFTAENAPSSDQDLATETVTLTLNQWKEVKFSLTDKELTFTGERIINDHIAPAAYALANDIDEKLVALYTDIPWYVPTTASPAVIKDMVAVRTMMFNNKVPMDPSRLHLMLDGTLEGEYLAEAAFSQQQGAGDAGVTTQRTGHLGMKFGFEVFSNQNTPTHTTSTMDDVDQDVNGELAKGATSMDTTLAGTGTIIPGDTFVFASHTQRYAVTNTTTAGANAHTGVTFTPQLTELVADAVLITFKKHGTYVNALGFHKNAFALVTAPLSNIGAEAFGAKIAIAVDPVTGLSVRSRLFYIPDSSKVKVALDILYGVKTLDPNLACRFINSA